MKGIFPEIFHCPLDEGLACLADAAPQNDDLRVCHAADICQKQPQISVYSFQNGKGSRIAFFCGGKNISGFDLFRLSQDTLVCIFRKIALGNAYDACGGAILFRAAVFAAAAGLCFPGLQHHMPDLPAGAVNAVDDLSFYHNTPADTSAQGRHDHIFIALTTAFPAFPKGCHVGKPVRAESSPCRSVTPQPRFTH